MQVAVYIDESGDTGWTFAKPNRHGGSSRYLTIAYLIVPLQSVKELARLVRRIYKKYGLNLDIEKKGASFGSAQARYIAARIANMMNERSGFVAGAITVNE